MDCSFITKKKGNLLVAAGSGIHTHHEYFENCSTGNSDNKVAHLWQSIRKPGHIYLEY
jgi:hypothetical protein